MKIVVQFFITIQRPSVDLDVNNSFLSVVVDIEKKVNRLYTLKFIIQITFFH